MSVGPRSGGEGAAPMVLCHADTWSVCLPLPKSFGRAAFEALRLSALVITVDVGTGSWEWGSGPEKVSFQSFFRIVSQPGRCGATHRASAPARNSRLLLQLRCTPAVSRPFHSQVCTRETRKHFQRSRSIADLGCATVLHSVILGFRFWRGQVQCTTSST